MYSSRNNSFSSALEIAHLKSSTNTMNHIAVDTSRNNYGLCPLHAVCIFTVFWLIRARRRMNSNWSKNRNMNLPIVHCVAAFRMMISLAKVLQHVDNWLEFILSFIRSEGGSDKTTALFLCVQKNIYLRKLNYFAENVHLKLKYQNLNVFSNVCGSH